MKDKILDLLKGSPKPLQSKELAILMKEVHMVNIQQYQVRDILWGDLKEEVVYRGKPHWDYKIKENFKVKITFKSKRIQYHENNLQPLCSLQISYLKSEIIYYINKSSKYYSSENENLILFFLEAWEKMLLNNSNSESFFNEYVTYLKE